MGRYEKWLGAGLGWMMTGSPLGGLVGFISGSLLGKGKSTDRHSMLEGVSELETNLLVLASHLIKIDGKVNLREISFTQQFLDTHFDAEKSVKRTDMLNHCLQKEYDLNVVCDQLRMYASHASRIQIVRFLFDLAISDGELSEHENFFIFKVSGYLNINDVDFRKIKKEHTETIISEYELIGVQTDALMSEITSVYRKLVLQYHPDRHAALSEEEKKKLAIKFQQIQEAYQKIKREKRGN